MFNWISIIITNHLQGHLHKLHLTEPIIHTVIIKYCYIVCTWRACVWGSLWTSIMYLRCNRTNINFPLHRLWYNKALNTIYFGFMFWIDLWVFISHPILAFINMASLLQYVTTSSPMISSVYSFILFIYKKRTQIFVSQFHKNGTLKYEYLILYPLS